MLQKIADAKAPCTHPEHYPPSMIVLQPGVYQYACPACGQKSSFTIGGTYC